MFLYFPTYMMARSVMDYVGVRSKLWLAGLVIFVFAIYVAGMESETTQDGYDARMAVGYQFGLCALIFFDKFRQNEKNPNFDRTLVFNKK